MNELARGWYLPSDSALLEEIFHKLKESESEDESEDEKIRKWLITQLELKSDVNNSRELELMILKSIAWLEKQVEQKSINNGPKFKIGDIISNSNVIYRVDGIIKNCLGQACYFLVNVQSEKNGTRYLLLTNSDGKTTHFGEITWLCEQVDKIFKLKR